MNDSSIKIPMSQYRELLVRYLAPQRRLVSSLAMLLVFGLGLQLTWISQIDPSGDWRSCDYYEYSDY